MRISAFVFSLALASGATGQEASDAVAPEAATQGAFQSISPAVAAALKAKAAGQPTEASNYMVAAANPHAVEAGRAVLAAGGSAADALVAVQAVLGLVEPQSSGLGGGAFLIYFDASTGTLTTLDGRETAPLAATPTLFQSPDGEPLQFFDAVVGGRSVGTPGTPALLEAAHKRWGKIGWGPHFDAAIGLAETGFTVSPRLAGLIERDAERLQRFAATADYFFPGGQALVAGDRLTNQAYADTLRAIRTAGSEAFYTGGIAADIIDAIQNAEGNPGVLSATDLAIYQVKERVPVLSLIHI